MAADCKICERKPIRYRQSGLCVNCYQWMHSKMYNTPTQNMHYIQRVDLASSRIMRYFGKRKHLRKVK